uniref:(northern house mosquito) hypothetical protein n=1 Tax=Culex pipiens TaxID=7175 RepID=A0A8D8JPF3_CULPI
MKHVFLFVSVIYIKSINDTHTRYLYIQKPTKTLCIHTCKWHTLIHNYFRGSQKRKKIGKSGGFKVIFILYSREQRGKRVLSERRKVVPYVLQVIILYKILIFYERKSIPGERQNGYR